ncbi:hypothetical protein HYH02_006521 [Chlamydomonas schloesseri]|uniref:RanBP2-type domain-containing protein n=1 Tax=Chlamydomonas schloesseri TaxID=2026947 RepID=A0A835WJ47_9CHLO|nr:hypothetical protein HYH02_006521 [Chlamydomonas schloesseri]|eukprot:KAG2448634.1 hypothetical protein HYH02_006521 [Chlamydomonas schloesseri]
MLGHSSLGQLRHGANYSLRLAPPVSFVAGRALLATSGHRQLCFASAAASSAHAPSSGDSEPAAHPPPLTASETPAATASASLRAETGASNLELWHALLRVLHEQGDFEDPDTPVDELLDEHDDVKAALLSFARRRPDILFSLPEDKLSGLAAVEPLPRDKPDRKLRNAARRLAETYARSRIRLGAGALREHASFQDAMRVLWDWAEAAPGRVEAAAPGLGGLVKELLVRVTAAASSEPAAEAMARAAELEAEMGTPSAAALAERAATELTPEQRRRAKEAEAAARKHQQRLRRAAANGNVVEAGDWFCGECGAANYSDRRRCFRCDYSSEARSNTVVSQDDIRELYGSRPPRRRKPRGVVEAAATADADSMYGAQAAAAAAAAADVAAGAAQAAAPSRSAKPGRDAAPGRRGPTQLEEDADHDDAAVRRGAQKPWERRQQDGDRPPRPQGRPGLRWRADAEDEAGGGEVEGRRGRSRRVDAEEEAAADGEEAGPGTTEARHTPAYRRNMRDFYGSNGAGSSGSGSGRQQGFRGRDRDADVDGGELGGSRAGSSRRKGWLHEVEEDGGGEGGGTSAGARRVRGGALGRDAWEPRTRGGRAEEATGDGGGDLSWEEWESPKPASKPAAAAAPAPSRGPRSQGQEEAAPAEAREQRSAGRGWKEEEGEEDVRRVGRPSRGGRGGGGGRGRGGRGESSRGSAGAGRRSWVEPPPIGGRRAAN